MRKKSEIIRLVIDLTSLLFVLISRNHLMGILKKKETIDLV